VDDLLAPGPVAAERAAAALRAVPRAAFLPPEARRRADVDLPILIGWGATNSQPSTVREMLALLDVRPGDRCLDVGAGSGWTTALLAHLVGPAGRVVGVEIVPELVEMAQANLAAVGLDRLAGADGSTGARARVIRAVDDELGAPSLAPFDRILVSADAGFVPRALAGQLADGGRLVLPAAGRMLVVDREPAGLRVRRAPGAYSFVRLVVGRGEDELRG
jgi:protein-L-isoaspartate(D-aspartate) O-methyltransferase